jgi:hypothetical protein
MTESDPNGGIESGLLRRQKFGPIAQRSGSGFNGSLFMRDLDPVPKGRLKRVRICALLRQMPARTEFDP